MIGHAEFTIFYEGKALRDSRMDVHDLAPVLLALGNMIGQANRILNGDKSTVRINVKAFQAGCFGINFEVIQSLASTVMDLLKSGSKTRDVLEILNLLGITPFASVFGLYQLTKKMRGKNSKNVKKLEHGTVSLEYETAEGNTEEIIINAEVAQLYKNKPIRDAAAETIAPLSIQEIESLYCVCGEHRQLLAEKGDVEYFAPPQLEPMEIKSDEQISERKLSIESLSFKKDIKWRLSDGSAVLSVKISDKTFLDDVNNMRSFAKGDVLRIRMRTRVFVGTGDRLKTEYEALEVIEHIHPVRQLFLPFTLK